LHELTSVLDKLDANKDGFISFGEFVKAVKELQGGNIEDLKDVVHQLQKEDKSLHVPSVPAKAEPGILIEEKETIVKILPQKSGSHHDVLVEKEEIIEIIPEKGEKIVLEDKIYDVEVFHTFIWKYRGTNVDLVGDFTNWGEHPIPLKVTPEGHVITIPLHPGTYEFRFIIDGWYEWCYDILAPHRWNPYGYVNNVITL